MVVTNNINVIEKNENNQVKIIHFITQHQVQAVKIVILEGKATEINENQAKQTLSIDNFNNKLT